ncbi:MAG: hypothetical protein IJU19_00320 [Bacteroidales bacterium]|nr:hypothetical protein [Bacteroidales bacterium]
MGCRGAACRVSVGVSHLYGGDVKPRLHTFMVYAAEASPFFGCGNM